jgi:DNA-binding LytR/AlgR family response regulator
MNTTRIIIVDDEQIWLMQLQLLAEQFGFEVVGCYQDVISAISDLPKISFDIALLDIEMEGKNVGIELGKLIKHTYQKPIIFITGSLDKHTAQEALAAQPNAYLTKPINETSLYIAIYQALDNFEQPTKTINAHSIIHSFFVKVGNRHKRILWNEVLALESDKKYTKVWLTREEVCYYIGSTLTKTIEVVLPKHLQSQFAQINRAEVVNIEHIKELRGNIVVTSTKDFQTTDGYLQKLKKKLNIT